MKPKDFENLKAGTYRIYWKRVAGGGFTTGCIGKTFGGSWVHVLTKEPLAVYWDWSPVDRVELIEEFPESPQEPNRS